MRLQPEVLEALLALAENPETRKPFQLVISPENLERTTIEVGHAFLLLEGEIYLKGRTHTDHKGQPYLAIVHGLTLEGHRFLAQLRTEPVRQEIDKAVEKHHGFISIAAIQAIW